LRIDVGRLARFWFLAFGCSFALVPPARGGAADDTRRLLEMSESPDMDQRTEICRQINDGHPVPFARFFCQGYDLAVHGFDADAEAALDNALLDRPDFALAAILFGDLYAHRNDPDQAERYYRRAIEIAPNRTDARFSLGSLLVRRGKTEGPKPYEAALEVFRQMTEVDPGSPDGWSNLGLVLTYLGRTDEAEAMYKRALEINPGDPFLHDSLGSLYVRLDRTEQAEASYLKAISLNPGYGEAVAELAALYARTGRLVQAIQLLERERDALTAPPWGARIRRNLGFAYLGIDRLDLAGDRFNEATDHGADPLSQLGLAHFRMLQDNPRGALVAFVRGAELDSALTVTFLRPWRDRIRPLVDPKRLPELDRLLGVAEALPPVSDPGSKATARFVAFVLEGWSFANAAQVNRQIDAAVADARTQYDTPPIPVRKFPAEYPESAERAGLRGTVQVKVTVDETGNVADARVEKCDAPNPLFGWAGAAAPKWTFQPATRYGSAVQATVVIPFRFTTSSR
jgi:TonB family protein